LPFRGFLRGRRGAFSLVEVVIALAILVAIASLVLPSLVARTSGRAEREAIEMTRAACSRASSESQRAGVPVLLAAVSGRDHVRLVGSRVERGDDETGVVRELFSIDLPAGMTIAMPGALDGGGATSPGAMKPTRTSDAAGDEGGMPVPGARVTLTLAFPDGRCAGGDFDLVTSGTKRARFSLSEWTSTVRVRTINTSPPGDKPAESIGADAPAAGDGIGGDANGGTLDEATAGSRSRGNPRKPAEPRGGP
jgi:type II secretory pathway pseudopilin PulG